MTNYLPFLIAAAGAAASWYCYRWGHDDGRAEGYDSDRTAGLLEGAGVVSPNAAGGPGAVRR